MSLISGFAAVNQAEQAGGGEQRQLTLEAREARAITAWEHALALIAAQRVDEAQVGCWGARTQPAARRPGAQAHAATRRHRRPCLAPASPPCQAALRALLEDPAVDGCATDQLHRIKFLSLKNLGELLARRGAAAAPEALAVYCQATQVGAGAWEREHGQWREPGSGPPLRRSDI